MVRFLPRARSFQAGVAFAFITVALDMLAVGVVIPVLPELVKQMEGGDTASAATVVAVFAAAWSVMQFIFMPILGALSDAIGRRPVILIANLGLGLDFILMALAPNLAWLFVGRLISGACAAAVTTSNAYIADVTPPEKRAAAFGLMGAAFGLGFILGPALGGWLGAAFGPRAPFWVASGLCLVAFVYGVFILPESLAKENRRPFQLRRSNPLTALTFLWSRPALRGLSGARFLEMLAQASLPTVFVLYAGYRYGYGTDQVGLALALVGACNLVVQTFLVGPVVKTIGERGTLALGLSFGIAGFLTFGLAAPPWMFWAAIVLLAPWGLAGPAAQSILSRQVSAQEQGRLQGALSSLVAAAGILGPLIFGPAFGYAVAHPLAPTGLPFLIAGLFIAAALPIAWAASKSVQPVKSAIDAPPPSTPAAS